MDETVSTDTQATVDVVAGLIRDVIAEEWVQELSIDRETSFGEDLEFESIEIVGLAEKLKERYGDRVDVVAWMSEMDLDEIIELRVGQLVDFIDSCP